MRVWTGHPYPLGATWDGIGVNFAIFSEHAEAIELCLYANVKESEAARMMGLKPTSPVAVYANNGLRKLIEMASLGALPKFRAEDYQEAS